jgi:hypothetical protein
VSLTLQGAYDAVDILKYSFAPHFVADKAQASSVNLSFEIFASVYALHKGQCLTVSSMLGQYLKRYQMFRDKFECLRFKWIKRSGGKVNAIARRTSRIETINSSFYATYKAKRLSIARYLSTFHAVNGLKQSIEQVLLIQSSAYVTFINQ